MVESRKEVSLKGMPSKRTGGQGFRWACSGSRLEFRCRDDEIQINALPSRLLLFN
jgi:hypothetical protein